MPSLITLFKTDSIHILRDKTLLMMLFLPFLLLLGVKYALPSLTELIPNVEAYYPLLLAATGITTGLLGGYVIAFVMLDEKEEGTFEAIRVMPISTLGFVLYRLFLGFLWSLLFAFLTFVFFDIVGYSWLERVVYACLCALTSPITMLVIVIFASNKIEGMTYIKGFNFFIFIPVISFFVPPFWGYFFGVFPHYWTYKALQEGNGWWMACSLLVHLIAISGVAALFFRREGL